MTNSSKIYAGDELLRIKTLREIERETTLMRGKGHKKVVIGDLKHIARDQKAALRGILCRPDSDIGAIFGAWREACRKQSSIVDATNWAGCAAPSDWISQKKSTSQKQTTVEKLKKV